MTDVTIHPAGTRNDHGDRQPAGSDFVLQDCGIEPVTADEIPDRASDRNRETLRIYCPDADANVAPTDRATIGDHTYDVAGVPARWENPFTGERPGCVITLTRDVG